jgi:hypothetical protein
MNYPYFLSMVLKKSDYLSPNQVNKSCPVTNSKSNNKTNPIMAKRPLTCSAYAFQPKLGSTEAAWIFESVGVLLVTIISDRLCQRYLLVASL